MKRTLGYTTYQGRSHWYIQHWGSLQHVREGFMEDDVTKIGVMVFSPNTNQNVAREFWTYASNGMSERRMPCLVEPHGDPEHRLELLAYSRAYSPWIEDLILEIAQYPFL